ncbi:MAG: hypothetical protein JWL85_99 [Candidatus Saccharibacteria bacterium]|nr:hypothetical protein [Candidatus Saccharibacteria bacterium]
MGELLDHYTGQTTAALFGMRSSPYEQIRDHASTKRAALWIAERLDLNTRQQLLAEVSAENVEIDMAPFRADDGTPIEEMNFFKAVAALKGLADQELRDQVAQADEAITCIAWEAVRADDFRY